MLSVQTKPNQGGDNLASPSISSTVIASVTISISSFISVSGWRTGDRGTLGGSGPSLKQTTSKSRGADRENNTTNCLTRETTWVSLPEMTTLIVKMFVSSLFFQNNGNSRHKNVIYNKSTIGNGQILRLIRALQVDLRDYRVIAIFIDPWYKRAVEYISENRKEKNHAAKS